METNNTVSLIDRLSVVIHKDRANIAAMLHLIGEIDQRKGWAEYACSSMFAFLVQRFHMSEDEAYKRIAVARAARTYPMILEFVDSGRLHLSAAVLIAPHLTKENHAQVLSRVTHKTCRQVLELVAELAPQADKSTVIRAQLVSKPVVSKVTPLAPSRYHFSTTISDRAHKALRKLKDLSRKDESAILEEAFELLLEKKLKQKAALTERPRTQRSEEYGRTIPAEIRREVYKRDEGQCAYLALDGTRCAETKHIEFHHIHPWARGGGHSVENVALRCRAHNLHEARRDYGAAFIQQKIDGVREAVVVYKGRPSRHRETHNLELAPLRAARVTTHAAYS